MKTILRRTFLNSFSLWLTSLVATGLTIHGGLTTLALGGFVMLLIQKFVKPILQVITLPLNIITLGFFSWVLNVLSLYLLTIFVQEIKVLAFTFSGANLAGFIIPKLEFNQLTAFVAVSLTLTVIQKLIDWVINR